ncbi:hypothetical protein DFQ27_005193 [Actinomortierella ambigua]|uniref:F-box domain-containing protein n=1 Tax=Actinomortierella ambigua TaxID=1343610 RepID=A0A9P6Q0Y1_9FUNG|nr:hypothetical protein DFQ27_005193 [Actinomortierella ambigua]
MSTSNPSIWSIQEIVDLMSKFLDRTSIVQCVQVSKAWHSAWLPSLWARIEPNHWQCGTFLASLPAHGDLIRILKCSRYDELELLGPNAIHLSLLEMPKTTLLNMQAHVRILQQNRDSLQSLSLILNDLDSTQCLPLLSTVRQLRNLKTLKLDGSFSLDEEALEYVLGGQGPALPLDAEQLQGQEGPHGPGEDEQPSSIQELSWSGMSFFRHPFNHGENFASKEYIASRQRQQHSPQEEEAEGGEEREKGYEQVRETRRPFFNITSLVMDEVNCDPELILNLTSRFPSLQRLSFKEASEFQPDPTFPVVLARHCPNLRWLDISDQETLSDDFIASLIRHFPNLTTLKASNTLFSEASMHALADHHSRDLVHLDISSCYNISSTTLQRFLCQCSTLRHLEAWDNTLNVVEMVASFFWMGGRSSGSTGGGGGSRGGDDWHHHLRLEQLHKTSSFSSLSSSAASSSSSLSSPWAAPVAGVDGSKQSSLYKAAAAAAATVHRTGFSQQGGWWACSRTLESLTLDLVYEPWSKRKVRQFLETLRQQHENQQKQQSKHQAKLGASSSLSSSASVLPGKEGDGGGNVDDDWMMTTNLSRIGLLLTDKRHLRKVAYQQLGRLVNIRAMCVGAYEMDPEEADDEVEEDEEGGSLAVTPPATMTFLSDLSLAEQEQEDKDGDEDEDDEERWIDFSLRSGLDHLRSLKSLSEISLIRIGQPPEHRVEQPELEWMLKHWPSLRKIEGLDRRNEDEEEGIVEDEPVNELVAWLNRRRPDIIVDEEYI